MVLSSHQLLYRCHGAWGASGKVDGISSGDQDIVLDAYPDVPPTWVAGTILGDVDAGFHGDHIALFQFPVGASIVYIQPEVMAGAMHEIFLVQRLFWIPAS